MALLQFRYLLPLFNGAVDLLLLIITVHAVNAYRVTLQHPFPLWDQRYELIDPFFLRNAYHAPPPPPLVAIYVGALPATILVGAVSAVSFPNGWLGLRLSSPFDLRWALLQLGFSAALWYGVGRWLERRRAIVGKLAVGFTILRLLFVPAFVSLRLKGWAAFFMIFLALAWTAVASLSGFMGILHLCQRFGIGMPSARARKA